MRGAGLLLLCLLGAALLSSVACNYASYPKTCCFDFYTKRVRKELVTSFYLTEKRCAREGVVLVINRIRKLCVDPTLPWVERIITAA